MLKPGRNPENGLNNTQIVVQHCLDTDSTSETVWTEFKHGGAKVYRCTMDFRRIGALTGGDLRIRQGRLADGPWNTHGEGPHLTDIFEENLFIVSAGGNKPGMTLRGAWHRIINNWAVVLGDSGQPSLTSPLGGCNILCWGAQRNGRTFPDLADEPSGNARQQSAYGCTIAGNRGWTVTSSWDDSAQNFRPDGHIIPTSGASRNSGVNRPGIWGPNCDFSSSVDGADIDKIPRRLFPSDVGPRQWRSLFTV
jgi:hypothetical protein